MNSLLVYMIKVSVYMTGFYLVFRIMLSRDTQYSRNRAYIILSVLSSFVLPVISLGKIDPIIPAFSRVLSEIFVNGSTAHGSSYPAESTAIRAVTIISAIYFTGMLIAGLKLLIDTLDLIILILRHRNQNDHIIRFTGFNTAGFSAFGYIFIDRNLPEEDAYEIIKHEQNHLDYYHSLDIIFMETVKALLWFNPVIYLYGRSLRAIHEYQADEICISLGTSVRNYQKLLMNQVFRSKVFTISHSFSNPSLIKKRMIMMTKKRSRALANIKLLIVLPVIAGLMIFISSCSQNTKQSDIPNLEAAPPPPPPPSAPVAADDTKGDVPFTVVDEMPVFKGGDDNMLKYVGENIVYPENAKLKGIQGKVIVRFAVEADGSIGRVSIIKGVDPDIDKEAFRVINDMTAFEKPAVKDGKNVAVWYMLPINFTLK